MEQNQWEYKPIFFGSKLVKNHGRCSVDPETRIGSICFIAETFPFWLFQTVPFSPANNSLSSFSFPGKDICITLSLPRYRTFIYAGFGLFVSWKNQPRFNRWDGGLIWIGGMIWSGQGWVGWSGQGWDDLVKDGMIWSRIGRMIWSGMVGWYGKGWEFSEKILSSG